MTRVALNGGFYQAKSIIANAQSCINLYPEKNQPDAPTPVTTYLTPGLRSLASAPVAGPSRANYRASNGEFFRVVGPNVYYVAPDWSHTLVGTINDDTTMCSFADNGLVIVLVDGSPNGYAIKMDTHQFGPITSPNFYGADKVDYLDTYFIFNRKGTNQFFISFSEVDYTLLADPFGAIDSGSIAVGGTGYVDGTYNIVPLTGGSGTGAVGTIVVIGNTVTGVTISNPGTGYLIGDSLTTPNSNLGGSGSGFIYTVETIGGNAFDPLDIAAKVVYSDSLATLIVMHQEIWLMGFLTSEIWYNTGAADFTFGQMPQGFTDHGVAAIYSVCEQDTSVYWLSQDRQGQAMIMRGAGYAAIRISTHAIENEISKYSRIDDAIGFVYQQEGHIFYFLTFPTANKTWVYDMGSDMWHERVWTDPDGNFNRHRANCCANVYGTIAVGDWETGQLYAFDLEKYTDNGNPISRVRSFPHSVNESNRIVYTSFTADMEVGRAEVTENVPKIYLRWSDNRGVSYSNALEQTLGATGQYLTSVQWGRCGMARDRVFELFWSSDVRTALQGAWVDIQQAAT